MPTKPRKFRIVTNEFDGFDIQEKVWLGWRTIKWWGPLVPMKTIDAALLRLEQLVARRDHKQTVVCEREYK